MLCSLKCTDFVTKYNWIVKDEVDKKKNAHDISWNTKPGLFLSWFTKAAYLEMAKFGIRALISIILLLTKCKGILKGNVKIYQLSYNSESATSKAGSFYRFSSSSYKEAYFQPS